MVVTSTEGPGSHIAAMCDTEDECDDLLEAVNNLQYLVEHTDDPAKYAEYVGQLNEFKSKLIALGPAKKAARKS